MRELRGILLSLVASLAACGSESGTSPATPIAAAPDAPPAVIAGERALVLSFGPDVLPAVKDRVTDLVTKSSPLPVRSLDASATPPSLPADAFVLAFGDTASTRAVVDPADAQKLGPEGFVVRSGAIAGAPALVAIGNAPAKATADHGNLGTAFAAYAALEELGFAFLHPLAPTVPATMTLPKQSIAIAESPAWRVRGMHLHTMHPLELTDLLEGWGKSGPDDEAGWQARLPEWDRFLEWMLANRQNRVEWVLLWADSWKDFADGPVRQKRLRTVVDHAHDRGIAAGADAALAEEQQHMFHLVRQTGTLDDEKAQIRARLDWLLGAGFDFFSTESGTTEFTHPDPSRMLAWMNEASTYTARQGKPSYIKAHCSTGQTADGYLDPKTGKPINFNFLPHFADASLGVMPHTVEMYGLDDPAPTYGNTDFGYMREFLWQEVGSREVIWHPETAYWITFDIDVPLFLPTYAERRVADLRHLAADEKASGKKMDGQMIFSSGWEWGYWLNDVAAARAAWNPHAEAATSHEALVKILAPLGRTVGDAAPEWVARVADAQRDLLIFGKVNGKAPSDIAKRNGMAYLEGFDAMADVASLGGKLGVPFSPITQPQKLGLVELQSIVAGGPDYASEIGPLLDAMEQSFGALAADGALATKDAKPEAKDLADDLLDSARITALRAKQVHGLYDYAAKWPMSSSRPARLKAARDALDGAAAIVAAREPRYRVEADRIAGWRPNPTAYDFTYLWFARSLYFWWRDEGKAVDAPISPCYLNVMDPAGIAMGEGMVADFAKAIRDNVGGPITECLAAPSASPVFPQGGLRSRP